MVIASVLEESYRYDQFLFEMEMINLQSQFTLEANMLSVPGKDNGGSDEEYADFRELTPEEKAKNEEKNKKKSSIFKKIKDTIKKMITKIINFIKNKMKVFFNKLKDYVNKFKSNDRVRKALKVWAKKGKNPIEVSDKEDTILFPNKNVTKYDAFSSTLLKKDFFSKMNSYLGFFENAENNLKGMRDIANYCKNYEDNGYSSHIEFDGFDAKIVREKRTIQDEIDIQKKTYDKFYTKKIELKHGAITYNDFEFICNNLSDLTNTIQGFIDDQETEEKELTKFMKTADKINLGVVRESIFKLFKYFTNMVIESTNTSIALMNAMRQELASAVRYSNVITNQVFKALNV